MMKRIIIFLLLIMPIFSIAQKEVNWDYPVKPGSEEWKKFQSSEGMVKACQIPEAVITTLSTDKLN